MPTYYVAGFPYTSELYHHGIKGQKWGVRRFQNLDRSYTAAGKKRYAEKSSGRNGMSDSTKKKLKTAGKVAAVAAGTVLAAYGAYKFGTSETGRRIAGNVKEAARQKASESRARKAIKKEMVRDATRTWMMSDAELLEKIGRLEKEIDFKEKTVKALTSSPDPKTQIMIDAGKKVATGAIAGAGSYAAYALLNKKFDPKQLANYSFSNPNKKK